MWNHVITCEIIWSYVKFNLWKNFTWTHMWNFTNERISHEITCDISHLKRFHMKSHVTFHMWKDFTWNTCDISHVKRFHMNVTNYKLKFHTYVKGFHMKLQITCTSEISHMWKDFTWNYKWNFTCEKIRISHDITNYKVKFRMYVKGFHMKLQAVAAPGLGNWGGEGFEGQTHFWGGEIELLNR
jgi:hypothetical protein